MSGQDGFAAAEEDRRRREAREVEDRIAKEHSDASERERVRVRQQDDDRRKSDDADYQAKRQRDFHDQLNSELAARRGGGDNGATSSYASTGYIGGGSRGGVTRQQIALQSLNKSRRRFEWVDRVLTVAVVSFVLLLVVGFIFGLGFIVGSHK